VSSSQDATVNVPSARAVIASSSPRELARRAASQIPPRGRLAD
jgi:hypothetical protein